MKIYSKTALHTLVMEQMNPKAEPMKADEMLKWISMMPRLETEMKENLRFIVFAALHNGRIKRCLSQIRMEYTCLLDVLCYYPEFTESYRPLYQSVLDCLLSMMEELSDKYEKYLDPADRMPVYHFKLAIHRIEEKIPPLVLAMSAHHADKTLQALLVGVMADLPSRYRTHSWRRITYLEELQVKVLGICQAQPRNISGRLMDLLLNLNFNTAGFIHYCKQIIEKDLADCDELMDKYDCLFSYKRTLTLIGNRKKAEKFDATQLGCYELLWKYLEAQLKLLDRKKPLLHPVVAVNSGESPDRLPVMLSVDVLTYFFKLMVKVGVIKDVKKCTLVQFICASFRTPGIGTANLSVQSVETKYRQVVNSSGLMLKSILLKMLKQLDEDFGYF